MSAHIEFRLGDYDAAAETNERAIAADRAYLEAACADRRYIAGYVAHDFHFLWAAALMAGRSATARAAAVELTRYVEATAPAGPRNGTEQHFLALPLYTLVRFGQWQAIIAAPRPPAATPYTDGVWRFARGMAYVRTGQLSRAQREFEGLEMNLHAAALDAKELKNTNPLSRLLALAARLLRAELAGAAGDIAGAVAHARAAVMIESGLDPDEPPAWHMPARHTLGALLLEAGQPRQAERVYREDLKLHPENGWALAGLADSLALQGRASAAADARRRLARAWASADIAVSGSRY
jgi:tetratricopeptide (TPR) repeat protein